MSHKKKRSPRYAWDVMTLGIKRGSYGPQWTRIYSASSLRKAKQDAADWQRKMQMPTKIVHGADYRPRSKSTRAKRSR